MASLKLSFGRSLLVGGPMSSSSESSGLLADTCRNHPCCNSMDFTFHILCRSVPLRFYDAAFTIFSGVTTGPANPASGGGGGIMKICSKNRQINVRFNDGRRTKNYIGA